MQAITIHGARFGWLFGQVSFLREHMLGVCSEMQCVTYAWRILHGE